jgi:hypothetical protein
VVNLLIIFMEREGEKALPALNYLLFAFIRGHAEDASAFDLLDGVHQA